MNAIGVDLGGTWIKGVLMNCETGEIVRQLYHPTLGDKDWKQAVAETVTDLRGQSIDRVQIIGLSAPGLPNPTNDAIAFMPGRLSGLGGIPLGALSKRNGPCCERRPCGTAGRKSFWRC